MDVDMIILGHQGTEAVEYVSQSGRCLPLRAV